MRKFYVAQIELNEEKPTAFETVEVVLTSEIPKGSTDRGASDPTHYVCGFLFDGPKECVTLIRKNRPAWQEGLYNGPGGKMEPGETPVEAMQREFLEECGVEVNNWRLFCRLESPTAVVNFLVDHRNANIRSLTDEKASWYNLHGIWQRDIPVVPNLHFLIPMALYALERKGGVETFHVNVVEGV